MDNFTKVVKESFSQYSGSVLQSRALIDVRDALKPSARQIFYAMVTDGFTRNKPFKKTLKATGSATRFYIHGDASSEGIIMRAGQPFSLRYPLIEVEGSYGNLMESGNWASPRYTSTRLSALGETLFSSIGKDTIAEWRPNYDDTENYPSVLPSKGFYNLVNGAFGIGVGAAASIPAFNLREVNGALVKLLWNPEISFDEIYCAPDFPTGGILLNEEEVKESLREGTGKACKLLATIDYEERTRTLVVREVPYGVYTNTICSQLEKIIDSEDNPGIEKFNDLTGSAPELKIYLKRGANHQKVLSYLLKNTSLRSHFGINFTMLENGRFPKVFTWKEALQSYLTHQILVYTREFNYDLKVAKTRLHIVEGILRALSMMDEVVKTIRSSSSVLLAEKALVAMGFTNAQAKAILDIRLARLVNLEVAKFEAEQSKLEREIATIEKILADNSLLKKEIEKDLVAVAQKQGDGRRTRILNVSSVDDAEEPLEPTQTLLNLTNKGNIFATEVSEILPQGKRTIGTRFKMDKDEFIISSLVSSGRGAILFFTTKGSFYSVGIGLIPLNEKTAISTLFNIVNDEEIVKIVELDNKTEKSSIFFFTKNGLVKKSNLSEYSTKRKNALQAITLNEDDSIVNVDIGDNENAAILTKEGRLLLFSTAEIRSIGRTARGVIGVRLNEGDYVVKGQLIPVGAQEVLTVSKNGKAKRTKIEEFSLQGRATKGIIAQRLTSDDTLQDFITLNEDRDILLVSTKTQLRLKVQEFPLLSRDTIGNQLIKLPNGAKITKILNL